MADNILIDGLIKFCAEKSKNIKLKAEPQVFVEIKQALEELKEYKQGNCTNDCEHYDSAIEYVRNKAIDEFTHQLKENLNQEFPSNYESTKPFFALENARLIVDDVAEQMKAGGIDG